MKFFTYPVFYILILNSFNCISQEMCGRPYYDISIKHVTCFDGKDGGINVSWQYPPPFQAGTHHKAIVVKNTRTGEEVIYSYEFEDVKFFIPLTPDPYKAIFYRFNGKSIFEGYICHSEAEFVINEPSCDLKFKQLSIDNNTESAQFGDYTASVSGSFCNFGYENPRGIIINNKILKNSGFNNAPKGYIDTVFKGSSSSYFGPGDTLQFYLDNSNRSIKDSTSNECRAYSNKIVLECDLEIDSFSASRRICGVVIKGKLKSKYLNLIHIRYPYQQHAQAYFHQVAVYDSLDISRTRTTANKTSGWFYIEASYNNFTFADNINYTLKWNIGSCNFQKDFVLERASFPKPSIYISNDTLYSTSFDSTFAFKWLYNGKLFAHRSHSFVKINSPGEYKLIFTSCGSALQSDTSDAFIYTLTGTEKSIETHHNITISPNPANNIITIAAKPSLLNSNFSIQDPLGKVVYNGKIISDYNQLNIQELPYGIYYLKIQNSGHTVKIIKN